MVPKGKVKSHRDLEVYQLAFEAALRIFEASKGFPAEEKFLADGSGSEGVEVGVCQPCGGMAEASV